MSSKKIDGVYFNLGDQLKNTRKMLGLTQKQLADIIGITNDYVSKIEKGEREPRDYLLSRIEKFISGGITLSIEDDKPIVSELPQAYQITAEEKELLECWGKMHEEDRRALLRHAKALLGLKVT